MRNDRQIARGLFGSVLFAAVNLGTAFVQFRLVVTSLAPAASGIWMLFLSMVGYIILFDLGVSPTLGREVSFAIGRIDFSDGEREFRVRQLVHSCLIALLCLSATVAIIAIPLGFGYLATVSPPPLLGQARMAWGILVVGAAFNLCGEVWFAALYGSGNVATDKLLRSGGQLLWLGLTAIALHNHLGLPGLAGAWTIQGILVRLTAGALYRRQFRKTSKTVTFEFEIVRSLFGPSLKYAATLLGGILILQTDNLVIASVLGPASIPGYSAIAKLVTTLMSLSMMLVVATSPFVSQAFAGQRMDEIKRLLYRNLHVSLSVMVTLGAVIAAFSDRIVSVWLGPNEFIGFGVVWVLIAVMLLEAHHSAMATATMATGQIVFALPALLAGILNIGASFYLAHRLGLLGVSLGTLCAQVITNNWYVPYYTMHQFDIGIKEHFRRVIIPISRLAAAVGTTAFICRLLTARLPDFTAVVMATAAIVIVGSIVFFFGVLSENERRSLRATLKKTEWKEVTLG